MLVFGLRVQRVYGLFVFQIAVSAFVFFKMWSPGSLVEGMAPKASLEFLQLMEDMEQDQGDASKRVDKGKPTAKDDEEDFEQTGKGEEHTDEEEDLTAEEEDEDEEDEDEGHDPKDRLAENLEMLLKQQEQTGKSPWIVRPKKKGRSTQLTEDELAALRAESELAKSSGMRWQERGPISDKSVQYWRGQKRREGSEGGRVRFGTRGGRWQDYYKKLARSGKLQKTSGGTSSAQNHHWEDEVVKGGDRGKGKGAVEGKHKGKGKGKSKNKGASSSSSSWM